MSGKGVKTLLLSQEYEEACVLLRESVQGCEWGQEITGTGYGFLGASKNPQAAAAVEHHLPARSIDLVGGDGWRWVKQQREWGTWVKPFRGEEDYQVYVPYVNRADLLTSALDSLMDHAKNVLVVDQSAEGARHRIFDEGAGHFRATERAQFTMMMNWAQLQAWKLGKRYNVFMHNDAVACDGALTRVLGMARGIEKLGVLFTNYDALACFGVEACTDVGFWDETFRWYSADNDYYRRLRLRGWKTYDSDIYVEHLEQQTSKSDPNIFFEARHRQAHQHYIVKWGGTFGEEKFEIPYNGRSCSLMLELNSSFGMV